MSSKRYLLTMAPVEAINGKMAQAKVKCKVQDNATSTGVQFYYGYEKFSNVSRFALRNKSRSLAAHPYSSKEQAHMNKFKSAIQSAKETLADVDLRSAAQQRFKKQTKYKTLYGFLVAEYIKNN